MHLVCNCPDNDDDRLVYLESVTELVRNDELRPQLDDLLQMILATPLGQKLVHNLPRAKAMFAHTRPCLNDAARLIVTAQNLCEFVVRDYQSSLEPEIGDLTNHAFPEAAEHV